jgi:hypothetical protein
MWFPFCGGQCVARISQAFGKQQRLFSKFIYDAEGYQYEKKPLKNNNPWMIISPAVYVVNSLQGPFRSTFFNVSSAMKAPPFAKSQSPIYSK